MPQKDWDVFATDLTNHVRSHWPALDRGAVLMPCVDEAATFALVFANNGSAEPEAMHDEVDRIREALRGEDMEDLGFGLSDDGCTWTMVVRVEHAPQQTEVGRTLQRELLKIRLEGAVQRAWAAAHACEVEMLVRTSG
jgi:hypothetical protein